MYGGFSYGSSSYGSTPSQISCLSTPSCNLIVMEQLKQPPGDIDIHTLSEYINNFLENSQHINK